MASHRPSFPRGDSTQSVQRRRHIPWMAGPLDKGHGSGHAEHGEHGSAQEASGGHPGLQARHESSQAVMEMHVRSGKKAPSNVPQFKHRHESNTVELFYDLFFVANLATFTANHTMVDLASIKNYIGFMSLLWFTWLQTSLFDVRFASDSVFHRFCKCTSFGVMTGFAVCGAIYDITDVGGTVKAFESMSIVLAVSRFFLALQYAIVLGYVRKYEKVIAPLVLTIAIEFVAAAIFLGTFWGFPRTAVVTGDKTTYTVPRTYTVWYVMIAVEACAVIIVSCIWRFVSFKHTHLVERIGLLSLIVIGEGIIGMSKSVSKILMYAAEIRASDVATIIAAVLLIYFLWVLYFDQIEHDRFGTIRQQIWALFHFPLHMAILLTVEGNTALILWNTVNRNLEGFIKFYPLADNKNYTELSKIFKSQADLVNWVNKAVKALDSRYKDGTLKKSVDYQSYIYEMTNVTATFGTDEWARTQATIISDLWATLESFVFASFGLKNSVDAKKSSSLTDYDHLNAYYYTINTIMTYFYTGAGAVLLCLAAMYFLGKKRKTGTEWGSIAVRVVIGCCVPLTILSQFVNVVKNSSTWFNNSPLIIPVVVLAFGVVIFFDELLLWFHNRRADRLFPPHNEEEPAEEEQMLFKGDHASSVAPTPAMHGSVGFAPTNMQASYAYKGADAYQDSPAMHQQSPPLYAPGSEPAPVQPTHQ